MMHAIAASLVLGLLPATAHGWLDANGTDFVVKPWSQLQTLAVRRRKRGWIAIQRPVACEPEHVVCVATPHNTNTRLTGRHWQHAQQLLLPCFSLFRRFPDLKPTLELRNGVPLSRHHPYTRFMLELMGADIRTTNSTTDCDFLGCDNIPKDYKREHCEVLGGLRRKAGNGEAKTPALWFTNKTDANDMRHAAAWSAAVMAAEARSHTKMWSHEAAIYADPSKKPRVSVLNRPSVRNRKWLHGSAFAALVGADEVLFEQKAPAEQALWVHAHDIIVAPHGAGLSNVVFARPCTVVLELYPKHFYLPGFYLPLVSDSGGLPYTGYWTQLSPREASSERARRGYRGRPIDASAASIAREMPRLTRAWRKCIEERKGNFTI